MKDNFSREYDTVLDRDTLPKRFLPIRQQVV